MIRAVDRSICSASGAVPEKMSILEHLTSPPLPAAIDNRLVSTAYWHSLSRAHAILSSD